MNNTKDNRPNILLIMSDQQSLDTMSCVIGDKYINTPALDSIVEGGILFRRAYCANPLCVPSRTAMFSGEYPHTTGCISNYENKIDCEKFTCVGKYFREAGYDTGYTGKWHASLPDADKRILEEDTEVHGFNFCENGRCIGADILNVEMAERFLNKERENPFFLVVSFNNPHNICEWARGDALPDAEIGNPPELDKLPPLRENHGHVKNESAAMTYARKSHQAGRTFPVSDFTEKDWREYIWAYYRMVESVDRKVGEVLKILEDIGEKNNTIIIFASDHGDCQGAHKWNQKTVFYDESARVPFVISTPERIKKTSESLVNTGIDFVPTVLKLAGIESPERLYGLDVFGDEIKERRYVVASSKMTQGVKIDEQDPVIEGRMVRSDNFKYSVFDVAGQNEELFDMRNDPLEMTNLAGDEKYKDVLNQHRYYLKEFCAEKGDYFLKKNLSVL